MSPRTFVRLIGVLLIVLGLFIAYNAPEDLMGPIFWVMGGLGLLTLIGSTINFDK